MLGGPPDRKPMQELPPRMAEMPTSAFTVTDTHLIFASESAVEQAIER
jgi:hypothetical protein